MSVSSYLNQGDIAHSPQFLIRVQAAITTAALTIQAEATGTANHANRVAYAKAVLNNAPGYAPIFATALAANGTDNTGLDADLFSAVNFVWNPLAGVV